MKAILVAKKGKEKRGKCTIDKVPVFDGLHTMVLCLTVTSIIVSIMLKSLPEARIISTVLNFFGLRRNYDFQSSKTLTEIAFISISKNASFVLITEFYIQKNYMLNY